MLYKLTQNAEYLQQLLQDGEIDDKTFHDTIDAMCGEWNVEQSCKMIKNLTSDIDGLDEEIKRLKTRKEASQKGVERLKQELMRYLYAAGTRSMSAGTFKVSLRKAPVSLEIETGAKIPEEYLILQPPKVDKGALKKAVAGGQTIKGVCLKQNEYINIK